MEDKLTYRHAQGDINRQPCVFARALLAHHAVCELAVKQAGRRGVLCAQPVARAACVQMWALLREKTAFAVKRSPQSSVSPSVLLKIQCGGLNGLKSVLDADTVAPDVHRLLRLAQEQHGDLSALPFSDIVKGVAAWKSQQRRNAFPSTGQE